jgi:hypothetical protein
VGMCFWLMKPKVKLFSQDLTPSSASPGAWAGGVLSCVSRASAPLRTAHLPLFRWGRAGRHAHGTCFTHSSPRMPGFRGESPLKTLRQWADERHWCSMDPQGCNQPILVPTQCFRAGLHLESHRDEAMIKESSSHSDQSSRLSKVTMLPTNKQPTCPSCLLGTGFS